MALVKGKIQVLNLGWTDIPPLPTATGSGIMSKIGLPHPSVSG